MTQDEIARNRAAFQRARLRAERLLLAGMIALALGAFAAIGALVEIARAWIG